MREIFFGGWKFIDYKGLYDYFMICDFENVVLLLFFYLLC